MNIYEYLMLAASAAVAGIVFWLLLKKFKYALIAVILVIPSLFFAVSTSTQAVTVDEPTYMKAFVNMQNAVSYTSSSKTTDGFSKNVYQYRTTQMIMGRAFNFLRGIGVTIEKVTSYKLIIYYKIIHWFACFIIFVLLIYVVWRYYIPDKYKNGLKGVLSIVLISSVVFALPVNMLLIKVANYDSFSTYMSLLGVFLAGAFVIEGDYKVAGCAVFTAVLGAMEKISSAPWYMVVVVLVFVGLLRHTREQKLFKRTLIFLGGVAAIFVFCLAVSGLNLSWILSYSDNKMLAERGVAFGMSTVVFPFTYLVIFLRTGTLGKENFVDTQPLYTYTLLFIIMIVAAILLYVLWSVFNKKKFLNKLLYNVLPKAIAVFLIFTVIISVIGAYVPQHKVLGQEVEEGIYVPSSFVTSTSGFHFDTATKAGYYIKLVLYTYGTIMVSIPTVLMLGLCLTGVMMLFVKKYKKSDILIMLYAAGGCLAPFVFALSGQPANPRYYAFIINITAVSGAILFIKLLCKEEIEKCIKRPKAIAIVFLISLCLLFGELSLYYPNVKPFSPVWRVYSKELNELPEPRVLHPGEAMTWGEEFMLAGRMIDKYYDDNGQAGKVYDLYTNYGTMWSANDTAQGLKLNKDSIDMSCFGKNTWFAFTRYKLYRAELPSYIVDVEPFMEVKFRGMTAVYIYRGDQLKPYADEFLDKK